MAFERRRYYYLRVWANSSGGWGAVDLWLYDSERSPLNKPIAERIVHWKNPDERKKAEEIARAFNIMSGYGNYIG